MACEQISPQTDPHLDVRGRPLAPCISEPGTGTFQALWLISQGHFSRKGAGHSSPGKGFWWGHHTASSSRKHRPLFCYQAESLANHHFPTASGSQSPAQVSPKLPGTQVELSRQPWGHLSISTCIKVGAPTLSEERPPFPLPGSLLGSGCSSPGQSQFSITRSVRTALASQFP